MLVVIETHPVQYHAPVYREVQASFGIPVTAVYGSDFSVAGHWDPEFRADVTWNTDLVGGYRSTFLARTTSGGATTADAVSTRGLREVLAELRPAAVMTVGYSPRFNRSACLEALRLGCPVLFRAETTDAAVRRHPVRARMRDAVLRRFYRRCARLLYIGQASRDHYRRLGCEADRLVFSPYCVDVSADASGEAAREAARVATRQALGAAPDDLVVLFAGKLSHRKGVDLLVPAVASLPRELRMRVHVALLGDGAERETVERQAAEAGVRAHVLGFRDQRSLGPVYHAADLLALPSRYGETWGLVVNEALHHGLPCVTSDAVGCHPDLIIDGVTGATCRTDSADALGAAIRQVAATLVGRTGVRLACRQHVARYSVVAAARGVATAYEAVVGRPVPA